MSKYKKNSNEHMIIEFVVSINLYNAVDQWIREIGIDEYEITNEILGKLEKVS